MSFGVVLTRGLFCPLLHRFLNASPIKEGLQMNGEGCDGRQYRYRDAARQTLHPEQRQSSTGGSSAYWNRKAECRDET